MALNHYVFERPIHGSTGGRIGTVGRDGEITFGGRANILGSNFSAGRIGLDGRVKAGDTVVGSVGLRGEIRLNAFGPYHVLQPRIGGGYRLG